MSDDGRAPRHRCEAVVFDVDTLPSTPADGLTRVRELVERLSATGMHVGLVTRTTASDADRVLRARPGGPGRLLVATGAGTVFEIDRDGLHPAAPGVAPVALDATGALLAEMWATGVAAELVRVVEGEALGTLVAVLSEQLERRREIPPVAADAGWHLRVDGVQPLTERSHDALLTLADGVIGTTGAPLLAHPAAQVDVVAAGVYDGEGAGTDLLPAPRWAVLDRSLEPDDRVHRVLDLHTGVLAETVSGSTTLASVRFVSLARPGLAVLRADITPPETSPPLVAPHEGAATGISNGYDWMTTGGTGGSVVAAATQSRAGARLDRLAAYVCGEEAPAPERAIAVLDSAARAGFERLLVEHRRAWAQRWEHADVFVEGDDDLQRAVRLSLFHLMGSVADEGEAAVGARGLTGRAYRGHVFWDADLFVLPFLAATHPAAARAMLEYRIRRLPAALARARREGRAGARFPWESAATGDEVTPRAGRDQSGRVVPIRTGESEVHIVGDVAWAAQCYVAWSGDAQFAAGPGLDLLVETARYWASRVRFDGDGRGHLYGVIGPDEYHEPVDDNAYTNVLARWNLRTAAVAVEMYDPARVADDELAQWRKVADALVDNFDPQTGLYEQFAGFFVLEPLRIADVAPRRPITADLLLGRERVYGAQVIKQADVLMIYHVLPGEVHAEALETNLDYYEPRTAHGSSLSPAIHASVLARAGRLSEAVASLRLAATIDLDDLTATGAGGVHVASMGGMWQALAFGFMGLAPGRHALGVDPHLPPDWSALEIRVSFRGTAVALRATPDELLIRADGPLAIEVGERRIECTTGETRVALTQGGVR